MTREPIVLHTPAKRLILLLLGSLALVATGVWLLVDGTDSWPGPLAGVLAVVIFGGVGAVLLLRLLSPRPVLRVDERGLFDGTPGVGLGWVSWEEIEFVGVSRSFGLAALLIQVVDRNEVVGRQSFLRRTVLRCTRHLDGSQITIAGVLLPLPMPELREGILAFIGDIAEPEVGA